jgi:hypothetical protein
MVTIILVGMEEQVQQVHKVKEAYKESRVNLVLIKYYQQVSI